MMNDWVSVAGDHFAYIDDDGDVILVDPDLSAVRIMLPEQPRIIKLNSEYLFALDVNDELHIFQGSGSAVQKIHTELYVKGFDPCPKQENEFMYATQQKLYWVDLNKKKKKLISSLPAEGEISHFSATTYDLLFVGDSGEEKDNDAYIVLNDRALLVYHDAPNRKSIGLPTVSVIYIDDHWVLYNFS